VARPVGQPGCSRRISQPGQLTIGEELLGYHNNNNNLVWLIGVVACLPAAPQVQLFPKVGNGWLHNASWYHAHKILSICCCTLKS